MTADEFADVWAILHQELFVPDSEKRRWSASVGKLPAADVRRNLEQYRQARSMGVRMTVEPEEVATEVRNYKGLDRYIYEALEELRQ